MYSAMSKVRIGDWLRYLSPQWVLRLGLGLVYLYSSLDILRYPETWTWALRSLPDSFLRVLSTESAQILFLRFQGAVELFFAVVFLFWFWPRTILRLAAIASAIQLALILLLVGLDSVTFRDLGLIGAALGIFLMSFRSPDN